MTDLHYVKKNSGKWSLGAKFFTNSEAVIPELQKEVRCAGWAAISKTYEQLSSSSSIWQLEYTKSILGRGELVLGYADVLANVCTGNPSRPHLFAVPRRFLSIRSCARALESQGQSVAGTWVWLAIDRLLFFLASLVAIVSFFAINFVCLFEKSIFSSKASTLLAVYGEWTNRTRHVLGLVNSAAEGVGVVVVGRPTKSLRRIREEWETNLDVQVPILCRPFSMMSSIRSLPVAMHHLLQGFSLISTLDYRPPFRELVGISFRCFLGSSSQYWWRRQSSRATTVVYGHTGLADTTMLEQVQQATGVSTIHAVHGVSSAYNFMGKSNLAVFRCGYDAKLYDSLGCYGSCLWSPMDRPTPSRPNTDVVLFTNFAHPMNPYFIAGGIGDELRVLDDVCSTLLTISELSGVDIYWKPHPALARTTMTESIAIREYGEALGFKYTQNPSFSNLIKASALVLTTPSTIVLDALSHGIAPIVLSWQGIDPSMGLSCYPLIANNCDELEKAIILSLDNSYREQKFIEAWECIAPAKPLSWLCLGLDV